MIPNTQRRRIVYYVATVVLAAWLWMLSFKIGFRPPEWVAITVLMFIPGVVSLVFRLVGKEGFRDVGWSIGRLPYWAWAFFGPLGLAALSFFAAYLSGRATLALHLSEQPMMYALFFKLHWPFPDSSTISLLCQRFFSVAVIGMVPGFILAFGEELGWRGYLLTRLAQTGWPFPLVLSGLIWGVWHFPFFVLTGYAHGAVTLSLISLSSCLHS